MQGDLQGYRNMSDSNVIFFREDHGGRRAGIGRRLFSYSAHIPERRGEPRRSLADRRDDVDRRTRSDRRDTTDIGVIIFEQRKRSDRRSFEDRRAAFA